MNINKILKDHELYLASYGKEGAKAVFGGMDLSGANLRDADLSGADLRDADLRGAYYLRKEVLK